MDEAEHRRIASLKSLLLQSLVDGLDFYLLPPMRLGLVRAVVHFALLAYLLLGLFRWQEQRPGRLMAPPRLLMPEIELAVYVGPHYALLTGSELVEIMLDHAAAWKANRRLILATLKQAERRRDTS